MIITIDGPSGTGKSTIAKSLAEQLGFTYFDTGAMYRALTYMVMKEGLDHNNAKDLEDLLTTFRFDIKTESGNKYYFANDEDVTEVIRTPEVTALVSQVAAHPYVREHLVSIQRSFGERADAVFEGRDLGTVVFPNATVKLFLTASSKVRAERRFKEWAEKDPDFAKSNSAEKIREEIDLRDHRDTTRKTSPLRQAEDAKLIDTSSLSIDQVVNEAVTHVTEVLRKT